MADIVTSRIFTDGERGITAQKLNDIVGSSVIQPAFYSSKPTAPTADPADIALILKAGAYAQVPISALAGSATQAQIWDTRLRSYNAIGNPNFEVDQRQAGGSYSTAIGNNLCVDRWYLRKSGPATLVATAQQSNTTLNVVPGTNFQISRSALKVTLTTQQASLAAGDYLCLMQYIEGPQFRELAMDVSSISLLVYSSVAGLQFTVALRDNPTYSKSIVKLCTIPTANTWTLISLPNIPIWPAGTFQTLPGAPGYELWVMLAAGSSFMAPAADVWQSGGGFLAAPGMSNFAASPVNSTFYLGFVQHEPGPLCTTLMDKPFSQNLDECLRYYQKSYPYPTIPGTVTNAGSKTLMTYGSIAAAFGPVNWPKVMAKTPTVTLYNTNTGAAGSVRDNNGTDHASATASNPSDSGYSNIAFSTVTAGATVVYLHYTADTGW